MSNPAGHLASGRTFGQYLLLEHLGADQLGVSWTAQQTALGGPVTLQFLHSEIASDAARLAIIEEEAQQARALHHPSIARVYGADQADSCSFIVSEFVEGKSLSAELRGIAVDKAPLTHIAIAIAEALNHAHSNGVIHGNLHARHILVSEDGRVKVLGFGAGKGCSGGGAMAFAGRDLESVCYLAPERIAGRELDARSDIFSFGVLLYEMASGSRPFHGDTAEEIADRILHAAPAAPQLINPAIADAVVGVIGRCIQKDPSRRYLTAGALLADLRKLAVESELESAAPEPPVKALSGTETPTGPPPSENEIETVATRSNRLPDDFPRERAILYVTLPESQPDGSSLPSGLPARMHEIVDETVYLADGKILDPFAPHVIAEFATVFDAVRAARKCLHDLGIYNNRQTGRAPTLDARLVVLQGDVETADGSVRGPAVEMARVASRAIDRMKLAVSADIVHETSAQPAGGPIVTVAGRTFYELTAAPLLAPGLEPPSRVSPPAVSSEAPRPVAASRRIPLIAAAVSVALLLIAGVVTGIFLVRRNAAAELEARRKAELAAVPKRVVAPERQMIALEPFTSAPEIDPASVTGADQVRFGALGLLLSVRGLDVLPRASGNAPRFTAEIRQGPLGMEIVPIRLTPAPKEGPAFPLNESASVPLANWIASEMALEQTFEARDPSTMERFSALVAALVDREEPPEPQTVALTRGVLQADPQFHAAQMLAIDVFERSGDRKSAMEAASHAVESDPENLAVRRRLARWLFQEGDPVGASRHFAELLAKNENDVDALTAAGLYALALNDEARFTRALTRLEAAGGSKLLHPPDLLLAAAHIDKAASPYFDIEESEPDNAALALKIGRIAVLRHMNSIAQIELEKLERIDPSYGLPMLRAYIYAQQGKRAEAEAQLKRAQSVAPWYAQPYTSSAEVYAILGMPAKVIESLETAVAKGEPTGNYVRNNPLFRYLEGESRFRKLSSRIDEEQAEISKGVVQIRF